MVCGIVVICSVVDAKVVIEVVLVVVWGIGIVGIVPQIPSTLNG